jgi:hypothetical protein
LGAQQAADVLGAKWRAAQTNSSMQIGQPDITR